MTDHPSILIVVSHERLDAYLVQADGRPQIVKQTDFIHDCQTGVPLVEWGSGDAASCGKVAQMIEDILGQYGNGKWALACPESFGGELYRHLSTEAQQELAQQRLAEVVDVDIANVVQWFSEAESC